MRIFFVDFDPISTLRQDDKVIRSFQELVYFVKSGECSTFQLGFFRQSTLESLYMESNLSPALWLEFLEKKEQCEQAWFLYVRPPDQVSSSPFGRPMENWGTTLFIYQCLKNGDAEELAKILSTSLLPD